MMEQLRRLYAEVDAVLEGWSCELSSDCCRFARTGRIPYVWPVEWELVERALAARGVRGALEVDRRDDDACPLLDRAGRCRAYAVRPFGCRTFLCARGTGPGRRPPRDALADIGRRVAALAQAADPSCDGPRPLTTWLASRTSRRR